MVAGPKVGQPQRMFDHHAPRRQLHGRPRQGNSESRHGPGSARTPAFGREAPPFHRTGRAAPGDIVSALWLRRGHIPLKAPAHDPQAGQRSARLPIVDDDPLSRSLLVHLACLLGRSASVDNDPESAVERALAGGFDAMLLDLRMPHVDGYEALRASAEFLGALRLAGMSADLHAASTDGAWDNAHALLTDIDCEQQAVLMLLFEPLR